MTHAPIDDDMLQAYLDAELEAVEAARVEAAIASDPALALRLSTLRMLGAGVRAAEADLERRIAATGSGDADALFASIEARLRGESAPGATKPALRVVPGGRGKRVAIAVTSVLALAAGIALMVRTPAIDLPNVPAGVTQTQILPPVATSPRGSTILDVEFGKHTGTHFTLQGESGEPIAVVWIQEDATEARQ